MRIKHVVMLALCMVLLCNTVCVVCAEEPTKTVSLFMDETQGRIDVTPSEAAFWEYPTLRAGEDRVAGTLVVKNTGTQTASMVMEAVPLPYDDAQRMAYLDQLMITVKEGDTVLYDNTYSHINDAEGGLSLQYSEMAPGEEHIYTIKMSCRYTYAGDPAADAIVMPWNFRARAVTTTYLEGEGLPTWAWMVLGGVAATVVLLVVITVIRAVVRRTQLKKKDVDK